MRRRGHGAKATTGRPALILLAGALLISTARAGVLAPEWSRRLDAAVISTAVGANTYNSERLFLLLADGRVLMVSAVDSLRELGRAPRGATALVALPTPARGASDIALLLAAKTSGTCDLVAWNRNGQQLWKTPVPGIARIDSLSFVCEEENRAEFCAWQGGEPWLVVVGKQLWQYTASAERLKPGFLPRDALSCDLDRDRSPALIFFDGERLAVHHVHKKRELRCRWPRPDSAAALGAGPVAKPHVACVLFDSIPTLLVVTGETLRFVNPQTGEEERRLAADSASGLPGPVDAVVASGRYAYAAGADPQGGGYVVRLVPSGQIRERSRLPLAPGVRGISLALLGNWPMIRVGTEQGPENLFIRSPLLAGTADNSPGYSGARLLRVIQARIDEDTFPDLVVLRTAGDARWRLDVFTNGVGRLAGELQRARRSLLRAARGQNDNMVRRAVRRVKYLERESGAGEVSQERSVLDRFRATTRRRNAVAYAGAFTAALLSAAFGWLVLRRRRRAPSLQIEKQPVANRVSLAADLIALDHNFMSKGNRAAGFERLIGIRNQHGLERDRDLGQSGRLSGEQLTSVYASAITRLIDATPTLPLLDFIQTTARISPRGQEFEYLELGSEELRRLERRPGIRLIAVTNHECPDYLRRFRIFANPEVRGTLEHLILDHIRHAARWAHIITSYTVNTQWSRRLLVSFRSDSPHVIPFDDPRAHITSQLRELATMLRPAIEVPLQASALVGPHERLWFSLADYIAVLEEARSRASGAGPGTS
ncbi:hypothetical protein FJY68_08390 [candidate division WOR-3 bacterium]|uniref:Uncharacterized protein n=1 Tax=candidate division WOR-3 bacterium TaxID=2052148 RepID=A0A937XHN4_UNCW3|nr:hypothetical protein [candidate division WOR-3 bacterium]